MPAAALPGRPSESAARTRPQRHRGGARDGDGDRHRGAGQHGAVPPAPRSPHSQATLRLAQAAVLALGAPIGWLALGALLGQTPQQVVGEDPGLMLYLLVGTVASFGSFGWLLGRTEDRLRESNTSLAAMAVTDPLTGIPNRRHFTERLDEALARASRHRLPVCVAILDIDNFKRINDRHGHTVGDAVLIATARGMSSSLRRGEVLARVGGEEFGLIIEAPLREALDACERLRDAASAGARDEVPGIQVTLSAGCALATAHATAEEVYAQADIQLYIAKASGRDRVAPAAGL